VQFTHIVDFMIIMPLGPTYIREMHLTTEQFGAVVAAYTVSAGVAALVASRVVDRFGRKAALLTLYAGFTTGTFLCGVVTTYWALLAARTVAGAFGGVAAALVLACVGDAFPDARRGAATGVVMSAFSVASIAGVPLGLQLEHWFDWHAPFLALGGLGVAVLALAAVLLPPLRGHLGRAPARPGPKWRLFTEPNHLRAFALTVALAFGSFTLFPFLATFLESNVGMGHEQLGLMYVCGGLATLVTLTPIGRLADHLGKLPVFRLCAAATLGLILVITNLPAGTALAAILAVTTVFWITSSGRMVPAMAMITASAAPQDRGGFMSLNAAVQHLANGAATYLAGRLIGGTEGQPLEGFPVVGLVAGVATAASIVLAGRLRPAPDGDLAPDAPEVGRAARAGTPMPAVAAPVDVSP
jgi:predicted MFS family arabinose efflux permease